MAAGGEDLSILSSNFKWRFLRVEMICFVFVKQDL